MKQSLARVMTAAWLVCGTLCNAQKPVLYPVEGIVVNALTGSPINRIRVALAPTSNRNADVSIETGKDGRFRFDAAEGIYQLTAERQGQARQSFGQHATVPGLSSAVVTGPNKTSTGLVVRWFPPAAISGRVVDDVGQPVEAALVQLMVSSVFGGGRQILTRGWSYTDDLGQYRFGSLPAGKYYLAVTAHPWWAGSNAQLKRLVIGTKQIQQNEKAEELSRGSFAPVFYPNTAEPQKAAPLVINPGQEQTADFSLLRVQGFNLTVSYEGRPDQPARLSVMTNGVENHEGFERVLDLFSSAVIPLPPGQYTVRLVRTDGAKQLQAKQIVNVIASDVEVHMDLKELPAVAGRVEVEGKEKGAAGLIVTLRNEERRTGLSRSVAADGSFEFPAVPPGKYRVLLNGSVRYSGVFVKQIKLEDKPLKGGILDVTEAAVPPMHILASPGVGHVKGTVSLNGSPVMGALALLSPQNGQGELVDYRGYQTESDGSFDFENVRPGDYYLLSVTDPEFEYANPAEVRKQVSKGKLIHLTPGGVVTENIEAIQK